MEECFCWRMMIDAKTHNQTSRLTDVFASGRIGLLQSPGQSFRGKNLDFPLCTIPTVSLYEKYGVFGRHVGIGQRGKSRFFPRRLNWRLHSKREGKY